MATAFDDLIPQGDAANDPFGDLIPTAKAPSALKAQPGTYGDGSSVAVFGDEATPKSIPEELLKAYNQFSRTAKTAEDLVAFGERNGFEVPLKEARQFIIARDRRGGEVGEGVGWVKPEAKPVELPADAAAEQQDIRISDGLMDRLGDLWSRGAAGAEAGAYSLGAALHDLNAFRLPWQSEEDHVVALGGSRIAQDDLRQAAAIDRALAGTPIEGETAWRDVDSAGTLGSFVFEQGVQSLPGMIAAIASLPAYIASNTGNIAQTRAANDGREDASLGDVGAAAPAGIASGLAERLGIERIFNPGAGNILLRTGKAATTEGATEAGQTALEYTGGTLGTDAGMDVRELGEQMAAASVAGAGMGGAAHPAISGIKAIPEAARAASDAATGLPAMMSAMALEAPDVAVPSAPMEPVAQPLLPPPPSPEPQAGDAFADLVPPSAGSVPEAPNPVDPQPVENPAPTGDGLGKPADDFKPANPIDPGADVEILGQADFGKQGEDGEWDFDDAKRAASVERIRVALAEGRPVNYIKDDEGPQPITHVHDGKLIKSDGRELPLYAVITEPDDFYRIEIGREPVADDDYAAAWSEGNRMGIFGWRRDAFAEGAKAARAGQPIDETGKPEVVAARREGAAWHQARSGQPTEPTPAPKAEPAPQPSGPALPSARDPERFYMAKDVRTPAGTKWPARLRVVEASDLAKATGDLQNRDRSRDTTTLQVQDIISKFDPELLGEDPSSDRGAPIVDEAGTVLSGNGRMLALNSIYEQHPDKAAAYRAFIERHHFDTTGMERPVLIRQMTDALTDEQKRQFVIESNKDNKLELSPVERARSDADAVSAQMLERYAGGDLNSTANAGFVEAFTKQLTAGEMGNVIGSDRRLTTTGIERIENAVVARAYDHPKLLEKLMESAHNEIRAITSSLANVAPAWAKMRAAIKAGQVEARYDITDDLADAAMRVAEARKRGTKPADILTQIDAFDRPSPMAEALIEAFYSPGMKRAASVKSVTEFLQRYIDAANAQTTSDGLFGAEPGKAPADILKELLRQRDEPNGAGLFDALEDRENANEQRLGERGSDASGGAATRTAGTHRQQHALRAERAGGSDGAREQAANSPNGPQQLPHLEGADADERRSGSDGGVGSRPSGVDLEPASLGARGKGSGGDQPQGTEGRAGQRDSRADSATRDGRRRAAGSDPANSERRSADFLADALDALDGEEEADVKPEGDYKASFEQASFTDRTSIYQVAAEAVGVDPDRFRLLPVPRQVALLKQAMAQRFGMTVDVDKGMQERFAVDQMLDALQNAQGMAYVLDLPSRAISLDGKMTLRLQKTAPYLGAFYNGANLIALPRRSNSFAHEWGHALDYHLLSLTDGDGKGLSGAIRAKGSDVEGDIPGDVRTAFIDLLNAMFFDKAGQAERVMQLEKRIAAAKDGTKAKAELVKQLERIKDGSSKARGIGSAFYKGAQQFDGPGGDYWTSPTEMMARSFEAFVSYKVEAAGLTTEFIGKGDAEYLEGAGDRFELTFPKDEERAAIFAAYERLFEAIADNELTAPGEAASRPESDVARITDYDKQPKVARERNVIKRELNAIKAAVIRSRKEREGRSDDPKGFLERAADVNAEAFFSMAANLRMIQARSGSAALQRLIDLLTKQDGRGDRTVARTFHEDVHLQSKRAVNRLANILKANGCENLDVEDSRLLRDLLTEAKEGTVEVPADKEHIRKAAVGIRHLLDEEFYVNHRAGIDLGYTRNGYLSRVLDMPRVWKDPDGFKRDAAKVYEVVFDNAFHSPETVAASEELLPRFLKLARSLAGKGHDIDLDPVRKVLKQISKVDAAITAKKKKGDDTGALEAKLEDLNDDLIEAMGELWDQVRPAFAKERAEAWLARINLVAGEEHNASAPDSKYTKHRELPPEADKLMEKFYLQDPVETVVNYLTQSARRTAYARRFGNDGAKRKALFERMAKEGVSPTDQRAVEAILDTATGRTRSALSQGWQDTLGVVNAIGIMALLPRAVISSIAEPFTSGLVTGDAMSGFKMVGMMIGSALGSPSGKVRYELARAMGIVSDLASDGIMEARYGQTYANELRSDRFVSTMFRRTGLTPLTRAQKTAGVGMAHAFLDNLAQHAKGAPGAARDNAIALMRELGIRDPEAFANQLLNMGRLPTVEELDSEFGYDYSTAQLRFSDMVVQNPSAIDRPLLSQNPVGRVIYGITGFSYAYWRNIVKRNGILLNEMAKRHGPRAALYAGQLAAAAAVAFLMGATVSTIRERLLNPKRWHDLEQKGELESTMLKLAFTRTFAFGAADTVINTYSGLKYQRDLSAVFVGPSAGFMLQNSQKMLQPVTRNSRKTNTAEYGAVQGAYSAASPFIAFGLARVPGGPIVDVATGAGMAYVTSPAARDAVATAVVGPKQGSPGPDGKKVKSGPTAFDLMMDRTFGERKRKNAAE